jgi:RNA-binding protein
VVTLTSKQKKHLRALGRSVPAGASIGKEGRSEGFVKTVGLLLERHELVKVRLPADPPKVRQEAAESLAETTGATCIAVVGRTALLYRPNDRLPPEKRVALPGE